MSAILRSIIALGSMPLLVAIAAMMIWRKTVREFLYFFYYLIVGEVTGAIRLSLYDPYSRVYYYAYWITDILMAIAGFLATYELFARRLFPRFYVTQLYRYLFPAAAIVIVFIAAPATLQLNELWVVIKAIHVLSVLRATVLVFFVGLMVFMGRQWGRFELGIALGFVIETSALLLTSASWTQGPRIRAMTTELPVASFDIACLIWLITFLKPEKPVPIPAGSISPELLTEARKWQEAAKGSLTQKKDSE